MVGGLLGPVVMAASNISAGAGLGVLSIAWMWLVGGNFVLTHWRLPSFLIRSLSLPAE
jgi:hypothetical protein